MSFLYDRMRFINKRFLNPVMRKIAGAAHSPIALVRHTGRRSGRAFATPIMVRRAGGGFVIALTYGPDVDWLRNLEAAGSGGIRWNGAEYRIGKPQAVAPQVALKRFSAVQRPILRLLKIDDFIMVPAQRTDASQVAALRT